MNLLNEKEAVKAGIKNIIKAPTRSLAKLCAKNVYQVLDDNTRFNHFINDYGKVVPADEYYEYSYPDLISEKGYQKLLRSVTLDVRKNPSKYTIKTISFTFDLLTAYAPENVFPFDDACGSGFNTGDCWLDFWKCNEYPKHYREYKNKLNPKILYNVKAYSKKDGTPLGLEPTSAKEFYEILNNSYQMLYNKKIMAE